ncbi:uncharacterized protein LOC135151169 [Daucus carota subsp. sativus]|uniref:uncharacterized protein LOC135151169 n=1 Tax=Daucus carota subsp. sativus TaxID=79200 RepID=UPI003082C914
MARFKQTARKSTSGSGIAYRRMMEQASSSSSHGFPATVPFPLYEQMVRLTNRLEGQNTILQHRIDQLYREDFDDEGNRPRLIARVEEIIRMAEDRLAAIPPYHECESRITLTAITDELRHVISSLREPVASPPASPASSSST